MLHDTNTAKDALKVERTCSFKSFTSHFPVFYPKLLMSHQIEENVLPYLPGAY